MVKKLLVLLLLSSSLFLLFTPLLAGESKHFSAQLTAATSGPRPVKTEATGEASFTLRPNGTLTYQLSAKNLKNVYMAHLHLNQGEGYGHIVAWLYPPHHSEKPVTIDGPINGALCSGEIKPEDLMDVFQGKKISDLTAAMEAGKISTIIHTTQYRSGELMGVVH